MAWPTTTEPRTNIVPTRFSDSEFADLDLVAAALGTDRSAAIRALVREKADSIMNGRSPQKGGKP